MNNEAVDVVVTAKGLGSTLTGSGLAIYGGLTANEWALVIGVIVGVGGLCVQIWDKYHAHTERTTNTQNTVHAVNAAGQKVVLLNAMYGTSGGTDNPPTPDLRNYMTTWWSTHLPTVSGAEISIDIMQPLIDGSGFMQTSHTQSDGIHPTPAGYKAVGEHIASVQYT